MKFSFSLLLFSLSLSIFAAPFELRGSFQFTGMTNALFTKRYEPVYAFTEAGRMRLSQLRSQGWSCSVKPRQTYLCSKANVAPDIPLRVNDRARALYSSLTVSFEEVSVSPVLLSEAESLTHYRIPKKVIFNGEEYPFFDYLILHSSTYDLHKVKWGEGLKRVEFIVQDSRELKKVDTFTTQSADFYDTFLMSGEFR